MFLFFAKCNAVIFDIEVLGKHTDYGGGRSVLAATSYGFCLVAVDRDDNKTRVKTGQESN